MCTVLIRMVAILFLYFFFILHSSFIAIKTNKGFKRLIVCYNTCICTSNFDQMNLKSIRQKNQLKKDWSLYCSNITKFSLETHFKSFNNYELMIGSNYGYYILTFHNYYHFWCCTYPFGYFIFVIRQI